jgi:hypothetical protein
MSLSKDLIRVSLRGAELTIDARNSSDTRLPEFADASQPDTRARGRFL